MCMEQTHVNMYVRRNTAWALPAPLQPLPQCLGTSPASQDLVPRQVNLALTLHTPGGGLLGWPSALLP